MNANIKHAADKLMHERNFVEAISIYQRILDDAPEDDETIEKMGYCYGQMRKFPEAERCYRKAVELSDHRLSAVLGLSDMLSYQFRADAALAVLKVFDGKKLAPLQAAYVNYAHGNICALKFDLDAAIVHYTLARTQLDGFWPLWVSLGHCYMEKLEIADAGACYERAYTLKPDHIFTASALGHWCALTEDWKRAWEIQEYRVNEPTMRHHPLKDPYWQSNPQWDGGYVNTLAVIHEGGLGDLSHFMRYVTYAARLCGTLLFCVPERYLGWVNCFVWPGNVKLVTALPKGTYNAHAALMSMPWMLKLYEPKMAPLPPATHLIPGRRDKPQVCLTWFGSSEHPNDVARSSKLEQWLPLIESRPDIRWVNVSPESRVDADLKRTGAPVAWLPGDLRDAAMTMLESDAVISMDTGHCHMAGSLGCPTLTLITYCPEWRWGLKGAETPLYPSMELIRQDRPRDWTRAIEAVASRLDVLVPRP